MDNNGAAGIPGMRTQTWQAINNDGTGRNNPPQRADYNMKNAHSLLL
ncbi:MAG: hypothetical protein ACE1S7_08635 [Candidatus Tisiphia sp.]